MIRRRVGHHFARACLPILLMALAPVAIPQMEDARSATLHGTAMMSDESVLPGAELVLQHVDGDVLRVRADSAGYFEIKIAPGFYQFADGFSISRMRPFRRARFQVKAGAKLLINVVPVAPPEIIDTDCPSLEPCERRSADRPPAYKERIPNPASPLNMAVRFEGSVGNGSAVEHRGSPTMLTYDILSVYASSVRFDSASQRAMAVSGFVEDGVSRRHFDRLTADLASRTLVVQERGVTSTNSF